MQKIKYFFSLYITLFHTQIYATNDAWILSWIWSGATEKLRTWEIHTSDIPGILKWAIDFCMWFAGTISIIFVIIWAYKIALWTLQWDKSKWKETIVYALGWFILAACSWLIMKLIIDNFS